MKQKRRSNGGKKMKLRHMRFPDSLWEQAKAKAGLTPLSAIVRKLVELWLAGKIDINQ
jgi:hypothetical protein